MLENKKVILCEQDHFYSTIESPMLRKFVLDQVPTAEIINNVIAVNYSDEGYCLFEVCWNNDEEICVEFTGTAC